MSKKKSYREKGTGTIEKKRIMIVSIQAASRGCTGSLYLRRLSDR